MARPVGFFTGIILGGTLAAVAMVLPFIVAAIVSCCVLLFILASDADSSNKESLFVQGLCGSSPAAESEMGSAAAAPPPPQPQAATPVTSPAATGLTRVLRSWDFISIAVCQLCLGIFSGGHQTLMAVVLKTVYLMPSTDVALAMAFASCLAWANAANDIANSVGTAVGAGAVRLRTALIIGSIAEFAPGRNR